MMMEMVTLQKRQSKGYRKWSKKWTNKFQKNEGSLESYGTTLQLLVALSSIGYQMADELSTRNQKLERVPKNIPNEDE